MTHNRYFVTREDGAVTGPHHSAVIRKEIDNGTLTLDSPLCLEGTEDWLPAIDWGSDIVPPAPAPRIQHYAALAEPVGQKSALRVFWALVCVVIGLVKCAVGITFMGGNSVAMGLILIVIGLLWGVAGMAELIRQSRKK